MRLDPPNSFSIEKIALLIFHFVTMAENIYLCEPIWGKP